MKDTPLFCRLQLKIKSTFDPKYFTQFKSNQLVVNHTNTHGGPSMRHGCNQTPFIGLGVKALRRVQPRGSIKTPYSIYLPVQQSSPESAPSRFHTGGRRPRVFRGVIHLYGSYPQRTVEAPTSVDQPVQGYNPGSASSVRQIRFGVPASNVLYPMKDSTKNDMNKNISFYKI